MPLFYPPVAQYEDGNGAPLAGALLYFFITGTSTPKDTYTTSALSTAHTNPVVADSNGFFPPIYLATDVDYKVILKNAAGSTIPNGTIDPYFSDAPTGRTAVADTNYAATIGDRLIAYTSLTASRTVTLPSALLFPAGTRLTIVDESGAASPSKLINCAPTGVQTINGSNTTQLAINSAYGRAELESNGGAGWFWLVRDGTPVKGTFRGGETTRASATTLTITAGARADSTNAIDMTFAAGTIDAATVGANGLDAGSLANTTSYHSFAIMKMDGTTAFLLSTSPTAPTMPSGYVFKKRLASHRTNGSAQIIDYVQDGDFFQWVTLVADISSTNPGTSAVTATLTVPTGVNVLAICEVRNTNSDATASYTYVSDLATTDSTPSVAITDFGQANSSTVATAARMQIRTNTSAQIRYRISYSSASVGIVINTLGWIDRRGRDA